MKSSFKEDISIAKVQETFPRSREPIECQVDIIVCRLVLGGGISSSHKNYTQESYAKRFHVMGGLSPIVFREEKVKQLDLDRNVTLVMSLKIINILVKRILINTGSSTYILAQTYAS